MLKSTKGNKVPEVESKTKKEEKRTTDAPAGVVKPAEKTSSSTDVLSAKKTEVKSETSAKKTESKKAGSEKKTAASKTKKAPKAPMVPEVYVQYMDNGEQEANVEAIVAKVKEIYVSDGHRESSIKSLKIYMKPQEWKAYYVINSKITGEIDLF